MKILIKNGTVVTSDAISASDILIHDGIISMVGAGISEKEADRVLDAGGMYVFPGGIDPHVHMHLPVAGGYSSDDFLSGSRAALFGGTTSIIDFVTPARGESLPRALEKRKVEAEESLVDYSFHVSPVEWRLTTGDEISECIRMGVTSFKVYMAYTNTIGLSDDDLFRVMECVGKAGGMVTVHAEPGDVIENLRDRYFSEGHISPRYHALSRPATFEAKAVEKAVAMADKTNCPLYIVHVSSEESLKYISDAQSQGRRVYAETCPQYLLLDNSKYNGEFDQTAPYVISPPLRTMNDCNALWDAVSDDIISTIGTDHCPFTMAQKRAGTEDFRKIPGGAGGVEHRLALLYTYGVLTERLSLNRMVDLFAAGPAKIFGLYPRKGAILAGSDADIVIWDPEPERIISAKTHNQNCDINIYEGTPVRGYAAYVIAGGQIIIDNGKMTGMRGNGTFLFRSIGGPHVKT